MPKIIFIPNVHQLTKIGFREGTVFNGFDFQGRVKSNIVYMIEFSSGFVTYDVFEEYWYLRVKSKEWDTLVNLNIDSTMTLYTLLGALNVKFNLVII